MNASGIRMRSNTANVGAKRRIADRPAALDVERSRKSLHKKWGSRSTEDPFR